MSNLDGGGAAGAESAVRRAGRPRLRGRNRLLAPDGQGRQCRPGLDDARGRAFVGTGARWGSTGRTRRGDAGVAPAGGAAGGLFALRRRSRRMRHAVGVPLARRGHPKAQQECIGRAKAERRVATTAMESIEAFAKHLFRFGPARIEICHVSFQYASKHRSISITGA